MMDPHTMRVFAEPLQFKTAADSSAVRKTLKWCMFGMENPRQPREGACQQGEGL